MSFYAKKSSPSPQQSTSKAAGLNSTANSKPRYKRVRVPSQEKNAKNRHLQSSPLTGQTRKTISSDEHFEVSPSAKRKAYFPTSKSDIDDSDSEAIGNESESNISAVSASSIHSTNNTVSVNNAMLRAITNFQDVIEQKLDKVLLKVESQAKEMNLIQERLKKMEDNFEERLKGLVEKTKTKIDVPLVVQRKIKTMFNAYPVEEQWDFDENWNSEVNSNITDQMIDDVDRELKGRYNRDVILAGCKTYFSSRQRDYREKEKNPEKYQNDLLKKKYRARKQRVNS